MKRVLYFSIILLIVVVSTFALADKPQYLSFFSSQLSNTNVSKISEEKVLEPKPALPEHIPYMFLFQHTVKVKKIPKALDQLKTGINLSDQDFAKFEKVADDCQKEIKVLDNEAKKLAEDFHRKYPKGKMPPGQAPPPPPQEIFDLQESRNDTILLYRNRLRSEVGEAAFSKIETFVKNSIMPGVSVR